jgi:ribosomal protein L37E
MSRDYPHTEDQPHVTCPQCGMTSYNPHDIEWGYCGNCHAYTSSVDVMERARRFLREAEGKGAYDGV